MKSSSKLILEIKKLNQKLEAINVNSKFMVYNANPYKFALFNFIAGTFFSLGSLFGTAIIAAAAVYLFSQINLDLISPITDWIETILSSIQWDQMIIQETL